MYLCMSRTILLIFAVFGLFYLAGVMGWFALGDGMGGLGWEVWDGMGSGMLGDDGGTGWVWDCGVRVLMVMGWDGDGCFVLGGAGA